jgi:aspartate carbamoyltransferase regulatory subunit
MVVKVENSSGLDGPSRIEDLGTKCATKKCETFGCRDIAKQMYQLAPGTNVWLCDKCKKEMDGEQLR